MSRARAALGWLALVLPLVALRGAPVADGWADGALTPPAAVASTRTLWTMSLMSVAGLAMAVFLVRWLARPLGAFARAAKAFSAGAAVSPVPEHGPREVRADAKAAGGQAAIAEEQAGRTQKVVVTEKLVETLRRELSGPVAGAVLSSKGVVVLPTEVAQR